jgi:sn1-specific diacylglycerol lipase
MARLGNCSLIYANFSNEVTVKPYAVFVDHENQALIITVRGTLSLEDCITDAVAHPESLYESGRLQSNFV